MGIFSQQELDYYKARGPGAIDKPVKQKKTKGFWQDQISTGGSLAGALGGAAAGTAVLPGVGTIVGGLLGGALGGGGGQFVENAVSGDNLMQDVGSEALWGGATALPFGATAKLAKAGGTLVKGLGSDTARMAAKDLVNQAAIKTMPAKTLSAALAKGTLSEPMQNAAGVVAATPTLTQKLGGKLSGAANDLAVKQFRLNPSQTGNFMKKFGTDAGETIRNYGFTSAEDIVSKGIDPLQSQFNSLVKKAGSISKSELKSNFDKTIAKLLGSNSSTNRSIGQQMQAEVDSILGKYGKKIPAETVSKIKQEFDSLVNYTAKAADPNKYGMNKRIADVLRKSVQGADSTGQLKDLGKELSKLRQLSDIVAKQSELGRGSLPLNIPYLLGSTVGGATAGIPGIIVGGALTQAVNSNTGRKVAMGLADKAVSKLSSQAPKDLGQTLKQAATRMGGLGATRSVLGNQSSDGSNIDTTAPMSNATMRPITSNMDTSYSQTTGSSSPLGVSSSEIAQAIMRAYAAGDTAAVKQLNGMYDFASKFEQQGGAGDISQTSRGALASSDNAINTLNQLEELFTNAGSGSGRIGGALKNVAANMGFDENAKIYNSLSQASVTQFAKALAGPGAGTVSDMDAKVILAALPTIDNTKAEAAAKFKALRNRLENAKANTLNYSGGGSDINTLASALGGAL